MYSDMSMRTIAASVSNMNSASAAGQLGLADAGRPRNRKRADRPVRILQAGA
jgi:hypothetical protein